VGDVVKSAERVLAIFEVFEAERRPLRISELVSRLEIPQSSTSTLMKTLVARGLVEFDPEHRTFKPTVRLAFLGNWVVGSTDGLAQIQTLAHQLAEETGEMVIVGSQNGLCVQYLSLVTQKDAPQPRLRPGQCRPLHRTGLGIMLLTQKADEEVARIVRRYNAEAEEGEVIVPESEVLSLVREARVKGYCQTANMVGRGSGTIATLMPWPMVGPLAIGLGATVDRLSARADFLRQTLLREVSGFGALAAE